MISEQMELLVNSCSNDEIDSLLCIKGAHAGKLSIRKSKSSVYKNNTDLGRGISSKTITTTRNDYYRFIQNFKINNDNLRRRDIDDQYDLFERPKEAPRQLSVYPHANKPDVAAPYVYRQGNYSGPTVIVFVLQAVRTTVYGSGADGYYTTTAPMVYEKWNRLSSLDG